MLLGARGAVAINRISKRSASKNTSFTGLGRKNREKNLQENGTGKKRESAKEVI